MYLFRNSEQLSANKNIHNGESTAAFHDTRSPLTYHSGSYFQEHQGSPAPPRPGPRPAIQARDRTSSLSSSLGDVDLVSCRDANACD